MKTIGREVLRIPIKEGNPRNGEGAFLRLLDGRIMFAYTKYDGESNTDEATAHIAAVYSEDEGESWSESTPLLQKGEGDLNIMSVSLLRLKDGRLGLLYLRKLKKEGKILCLPHFVSSSDEGKTFSAPTPCLGKDGYFVVNNDRLIRLSSGRIIFPFAYHGEALDALRPGAISLCYSDDEGKTFHTAPYLIESPYKDATRLQEPGLFELPDGRLWLFCRTAYGHQYQCFSSDKGASFGPLSPALRFTSPDSPMQVKSAHGRALAIFNPLAYSCIREETELWGSPKRTPYVVAISQNGGLSFADDTACFANGALQSFSAACRFLEDDTESSYSYPAVLETKDGVLIAYYHSNGERYCLGGTKITKLSLDELV